MDVRFINTWHDPQKERDGAASLFDAGADVVFTGADTPAVADVAKEKGKWAVTYDHPSSCAGKDACLTAPYWIWGPEYVRIGQQVKAKKYTAGYEYFDADSKAMGLYGFMDGQTPQKGVADLPAADVAARSRTPWPKMLAGKFGRFDVFAGPIKDNTGKELLPAGQKLEQSDLDQFPPGAPGSECTVCMYWWNDGITVAAASAELSETLETRGRRPAGLHVRDRIDDARSRSPIAATGSGAGAAPGDGGPSLAVEARGIVKRFPGVLANDTVDFDLRRGEVHALLGENGAGKSTLMNILAGLYRPDAGEILVEGLPVGVRLAARRDRGRARAWSTSTSRSSRRRR